MKKDYFKEIPELLEKANIEFNWGKKDTYGFTRLIDFEVFGITYYFELYANLVNCYIGKKHANMITFSDLTLADHLCSNNLALYSREKNFYINLKPLDWQEKYLKDES